MISGRFNVDCGALGRKVQAAEGFKRRVYSRQDLRTILVFKEWKKTSRSSSRLVTSLYMEYEV